MRILWTTAIIASTLIGAALAQAPDAARERSEATTEAAMPEASTPATPAAAAAPTVRAVIEAPRQAPADDWVALARLRLADGWAWLAPLRASLADISWMPLLLTLFNGLLALFAYRLWRASAGLGEALRAQSRAMTHTLEVLKEAAAATRRTADAALLQAQAAVGVELPRL